MIFALLSGANGATERSAACSLGASGRSERFACPVLLTP